MTDEQNNIQEPTKELTELEKVSLERDEFKAGWQRATADYQNLQKETLARRVEWAQMSERQILEEFIPVYENLKLAIRQFTVHSSQFTETKPLFEGISQILKQFTGVLKDHGVEEIKTVGEKFNPNLHEAAGAREPEPAGSVQGDNKADVIVEEVSGGYKMGDKVIKAAKVIVAK